MRTLRLFLAGTVIVVLLAGPGAVIGADDEGAGEGAFHATGASALDELIDPGTVTYTPAGVRQQRGVEASQTEQWSDPRLAGTSLLVHNEDEYPELMGPKWGTTRTENDGGAWVGSYLGMELPRAEGPTIPVYLTTMVGEGGYEGLSALCYTVYPGGPGWDGESECIVFEGPVPQIGGLPPE